jgi:chorismate mutase
MSISSSRRLVALRGATSCEVDTPEAICDATVELLTELLGRNELRPENLVSIIFTSTPDLTADFPASAARKLGLHEVPLLCAAEIDVAGALPKCIRILVHLETDRHRDDLRHVYLHRATGLRADLADG